MGGSSLLVGVLWRCSTGLDDVERETALQLHAGGSQDRAQRASRATLLADDFADIARGDVKAENRGVLIGQNFYLDGVGIIYQSPGNFGH